MLSIMNWSDQKGWLIVSVLWSVVSYMVTPDIIPIRLYALYNICHFEAVYHLMLLLIVELSLQLIILFWQYHLNQMQNHTLK